MSKKDIEQLLERAKKSLEAANVLLERGFPDFSASRSYFSMFYATEALLLTKGLSLSKHSGVISTFGKEFIKTGIIPPQLHRYITEAFEIRHLADYGPVGVIGMESAKNMIEKARQFIEVIENYLKENNFL